jgi:hypothetical protein
VRSIVTAIGFCLINVATGPAYGQVATEPANSVKPRVYALVAAVGEQFSVLSEVQSTGSHLSPYRRRTIEVPNNILNRLALHGLDKAIANIDPDSKRIYMALPAAQMAGVAPSEREGVAISKIVSELEKMPQRLEWDRIVIATPAYRALELNGLASKLQGFGLFSQPLCQARCVDDLHTLGQDGVDAVTSEDKTIRARTISRRFPTLRYGFRIRNPSRYSTNSKDSTVRSWPTRATNPWTSVKASARSTWRAVFLA